MKKDWNGDGKNDWKDDYLSYKLITGVEEDKSSGGARHTGGGAGSFLIPTSLLVVFVLAVVSGALPVNGFTILLAIIVAIVIWLRIICC